MPSWAIPVAEPFAGSCREILSAGSPWLTNTVRAEIPEAPNWVHANGGIINGGVACVGTEWRVFVCIFRVFCAFFVRFFLPKWPAKKRKFAHNPANMCKKRFYAIPPLVIPPFACHRPKIKKKIEISIETENFEREWNLRASHPLRPYFCGEFETSRLKFSSEIRNFDRDWNFRARLKLFDRCLWDNDWISSGKGRSNNH